MKQFKIGKKSGLRYFGYDDIQSWNPCYDASRYIPKTWRGTALDILKLEAVPAPDRIWVILRTEITSERVMRLFAVWSARQVQHLMKDSRSIAALDVSEKFANGLATREQLKEAHIDVNSASPAYAIACDASPAYDAAYDAYAAAASTTSTASAIAAYAATAYVAYAAYAAAYDAAYNAYDAADASAAADAAASAYAAARKAQIEKLAEMITVEGKECKK